MKPFLKWAGGKRWLTKNYSEIFPATYKRYIEPFLGSGSVFFHLKPNEAILSDSNQELITTYKGIKNNWSGVLELLKAHHENHSHGYYYLVRSSEFTTVEEKAARMIYLNRTCWNGLYRVNLKGKFNVPKGTKTNVIYEDDQFKEISELLEKTELLSSDFEDIIDRAQEGDLLFADPPYTVQHNYNGFVKYNEKLFNWSDQERLFCSLLRAKERGVLVVSTNAFHESIQDLYKNEFNLKTLNRSSTISSKSKTRGRYEELLITC